jgi:hypothetical protein
VILSKRKRVSLIEQLFSEEEILKMDSANIILVSLLEIGNSYVKLKKLTSKKRFVFILVLIVF